MITIASANEVSIRLGFSLIRISSSVPEMDGDCPQYKLMQFRNTSRYYSPKILRQTFLIYFYTDIPRLIFCIPVYCHGHPFCPHSALPRLQPPKKRGLAVANAAADLDERRTIFRSSRLGQPRNTDFQKLRRLFRLEQLVGHVHRTHHMSPISITTWFQRSLTRLRNVEDVFGI